MYDTFPGTTEMSSSWHHSIREPVTATNSRRIPIRTTDYSDPYVSVARVICPLYQPTRRHSADKGTLQILNVYTVSIRGVCNQQWSH
jgi:hypothetical protein